MLMNAAQDASRRLVEPINNGAQKARLLDDGSHRRLVACIRA